MTHAGEDSGLMSAALNAGSCFAIITAPLAIFGTHPLDVELLGIPLYQGTLSDSAPSYIAIAAAASLGIGSLGRRKSKAEAQSVLQTNFAAELLPREISHQDLEKSGLNFFLDDAPSIPKESSRESPEDKLRYPSGGTTVSFASLASAPATQKPAALKPEALKPATKSEGTASESSLGFEPEFFANRSKKELVLESWAEAFLSDAPLVALENSLAQEKQDSPTTSPSLLSQAELSQADVQEKAVQALEELLVEPSTLGQSSIIPLPLASERPTAQNGQDVEEIVALPITPLASIIPDSRVQPRGSTALPPSGTPNRVSERPFVAQLERQPSMPFMPAAQAYVGFSHLIQTSSRPYSTVRDVNAELEALEQLQSVREQIRSLSAQMEMIQTNLYPNSFNGKRLVALPSTSSKPTYTVGTTESASEQFQFQSSPKTATRPQAMAS